MKRILSLFAIASLAVLSLSCEKEIESPDSGKADLYTYSFEAYDADAGKSTFDGTKISWKAGDVVGSFVGDVLTNAKSEIGEDQTFKVSSTTDIAGQTIYSYVPYVDGNSSTNSVSITIPESQESDNLVMPAFGSATVAADGVVPIKLSNLGSIVAFKLYSATGAYSDEKVTSIKMTSTTNAICGTFTKDITAASALEVSGYDKEAVTVTVNGDLTAASVKDNATVVYAVIAPGTYDGNIVVTTDAASYTYPFTNQTFQRSHSKGLVLNLEKEGVRNGGIIAPTAYEKVTSTSGLLSGKYLIVYESEDVNVALNGSLTADTANNTIPVTINNGKIESSPTVDAAAFTYDSTKGSFLGGGGQYIGHTGSSNTLNYSSDPLENEVSIDEGGNAVIDAGNSYVLRYNKTSGQERFRYYKGTQEAVQLYRYLGAPAPAKTLTSIEVTGTPTKTEYYVGDSFETAGLVVTGTYEDGTTATIASGIEWTITPETLEATTTSVSVVATVGDVSSQPINIDVTVTAKPIIVEFGNLGYESWGKTDSFSGSTYDELSQTVDGVTFDYIRNTGSTYANTNAIRFYKANDLIFIAPTGYYISSIEWTGSAFKNDVTTNVGTCTSTTSALSWTGGASSVTFTRPSDATSYATLSSVKVTLVAGEAPVIKVNGISLDKKTASIEVGKTETLTPTITPADATDKSVTWSSNKESVATVSNGVVTGVAVGTAEITATTVDGGLTAKCVVTVTEPTVEYSTIAEIMTTGVGTYSVQDAVVMAKAGGNVIISDGTANIMLYHSGNTLEVGNVITITNQEVTERNGLYQFAIDTYVVATNKETPNYGTAVDILSDADVQNWDGDPQYQYIHFKGVMGSDNRTIKCGEKGIYIVATEGFAGENVEVFGYANGKESTYGTITTTLVSIAKDETVIPVTGVSLDKTETSIGINGTVKLTPIFNPANATNKNVTWSSSDTGVATVADGVVTGVAEGTATITVKTEDGNYSANCEVTVTGGGQGGDKVLTFDLSSNPGGWPTTNSTTLTDYTYTLDDTDYTFKLKNVKSNSGYLMLTQPAALGLPAIEGYKLTKVVAKNTSGCSTSVNVGISSSNDSANYIDGGDYQNWATQGSAYTYNLSETAANTVYYLYVTKKNAQITELTLTYEK